MMKEIEKDLDILMKDKNREIKKADISKLFGISKRKISGQEFKDLVREGWNKQKKY